jgi:hypothetical protein
MNTSQLLAVAAKTPLLRDCLVNVYPAERMLSLKLRANQAAIFNIEDSSGEGAHWIALYSDGSRAFFIDSYALPPIFYRADWDQYLSTRFGPANLILRSFPVQSDDSATCGLHSLLGIMMVRCNVQPEAVYSKTDLRRNDSLVLSYFRDRLGALSLSECSLLKVECSQTCLPKCRCLNQSRRS